MTDYFISPSLLPTVLKYPAENPPVKAPWNRTRPCASRTVCSCNPTGLRTTASSKNNSVHLYVVNALSEVYNCIKSKKQTKRLVKYEFHVPLYTSQVISKIFVVKSGMNDNTVVTDQRPQNNEVAGMFYKFISSSLWSLTSYIQISLPTLHFSTQLNSL